MHTYMLSDANTESRSFPCVLPINTAISRYAAKEGRRKPSLSSEAEELLLSYPWPGNIRELRNICEKIIVLFDGDIISGDDIRSIIIVDDGSIGASSDISIESLALSGIVKKGALAKELGMSRTTLWRKLKASNMKQ